MMMISTDGGRGVACRLFRQFNLVRSTRLDVATHQSLYTIEYKDITRSQVNAGQRISVPRHATAQRHELASYLRQSVSVDRLPSPESAGCDVSAVV
jgi:hypothetical protein